MASAKMKLGVLNQSSPSSVSKTLSKEASPDSKCPICLDRFRNISYVDRCLHRFCFRCIHEWSKNKAECPLCKQPFGSIYHSIKAPDDFKQFNLPPGDNGSFGNLAGQRFRYRTTLTGDRRAQRRTSPPPDHGVMFEGLSGSVSHGNDRGFRRMLGRLAARHRAQNEGRTLRTVQEQEMIHFRRTLYRRGLRVRGVRDGGRSRETSAEFFRGNPACLHRLVPWLKRELTVLYGTHGSLVNIVQHIVMSQITRYDMQDPAVLQELRPFLLSRTEHFLHEFHSFARSPFNMEAYDQNAVYDCPAPSAEETSGSDSSIITVSEDEASLPGLGAPTSSAMLSHTPWDDETPGPSYSSNPTPIFTVSVTSSDTDSEEEAGPSTAPARVRMAEEDSGSEEDCVIVGFVKPTAERTPELVQLSSNSEEEDEDDEEETNQTSQPQHIRFTSPPDVPNPPRSRETSTLRHAGRSTTRSRSTERHSTSPRRSSKNRPRESEQSRRRHSKSKRKNRSRSKNSSSHRYRRRSRSKDRKRVKEPSSYRSSHTRHSRSHHIHLEKHRVRSRDYYRSRTRDRYRSRSPDLYSSCTRDRSWSRSWSRSRSRDRRRSTMSRTSSPSSSHRNSRHEKPAGKRKCKSLHLECFGAEGPAQDRKGSREKSDRKHRRGSRSPSLELVYEEESGERLRKKHNKKRKKHKKKRKRSKERRERSSPCVVVISEGDSEEDGSQAEGKSSSTAVQSQPSEPAPQSVEQTASNQPSSLNQNSQNCFCSQTELDQ